jgi:hypothetical protein
MSVNRADWLPRLRLTPVWRTDRGVKVCQVPYFIRIEEEQTVECVIPPICKALEDWMTRVGGTGQTPLAKGHGQGQDQWLAQQE